MQAGGVDLVGADDHDVPVNGPPEHLGVSLLPGLGGEQLGIGQPGHPPDAGRIEHHGRYHERPRASPPASLVDAGDGREPGPAEHGLVRAEPAVPPGRIARVPGIQIPERHRRA